MVEEFRGEHQEAAAQADLLLELRLEEVPALLLEEALTALVAPALTVQVPDTARLMAPDTAHLTALALALPLHESLAANSRLEKWPLLCHRLPLHRDHRETILVW